MDVVELDAVELHVAELPIDAVELPVDTVQLPVDVAEPPFDAAELLVRVVGCDRTMVLCLLSQN